MKIPTPSSSPEGEGNIISAPLRLFMEYESGAAPRSYLDFLVGGISGP